MITFGTEGRPDLDAALASLRDDEVRWVLSQIETQTMGVGGVLERHWQQVQGTALNPAYARSKGKRGKGVFVKSGAALSALRDPRSQYRARKVSVPKRRLTVYLRRMDGETNVYDIAQRGKFKGVTGSKRDGWTRRTSGVKIPVMANREEDAAVMAAAVERAVATLMRRRGLL